MLKRWIHVAVLTAAASGGVAQGHAAALTPEQRADVVQTMRQALHDDPSILRDALLALQADEAARQDAASAGAITAERSALVSDPADPVIGNPAGSETVVEFYDPRCPYCRQMLPVLDGRVHCWLRAPCSRRNARSATPSCSRR